MASTRRFKKSWHDRISRSNGSAGFGRGTVHQTKMATEERSRKTITTVDGLAVLLCSTIERYEIPSEATKVVAIDTNEDGTSRVLERTANAA